MNVLAEPPVASLVADARQAGLALRVAPDGRLRCVGSNALASWAEACIARKAEVVAFLQAEERDQQAAAKAKRAAEVLPLGWDGPEPAVDWRDSLPRQRRPLSDEDESNIDWLAAWINSGAADRMPLLRLNDWTRLVDVGLVARTLLNDLCNGGWVQRDQASELVQRLREIVR
jgi:hypothetical protein